MENSLSDNELEVLYNRFIHSFVENRDPRMDLEINALKQLSGSYLEKAKMAILERLEKSPSLDAIWSARAINLTDTVPIMQRWLAEARSDPASKYRNYYFRGQLAYALYEFLKDDSYLPDVIETVKEEGYGEFTSGVFMLSKIPLTNEGLSAVWEKYKKGKTLKYPNSWRENCAWFLRNKIKEPMGQSFLNDLPKEEQNELLEFVGESGHQRLERKFRLEKYIYGRERYGEDEINRYNEYIKVGGSPVKGIILKQLWKGHVGGVSAVAWSPSGHYLASMPSSILTENTIRIWNIQSGECEVELQPLKDHRHDRYEPKFISWVMPDRDHLAVVYDYSTLTRSGNQVSIWNITKKKMTEPVFEAEEEAYINNLLVFPDGKTLLIDVSNSLYFVNVVTKDKEKILPNFNGRFEAMAISPDGRFIAVAYYKLREAKTGAKVQANLFAEGVPHEIAVYEVAGRKVINRFYTGHIRGVNKLCWMSGSSILAIASSDNTVSIWNVEKREKIVLLESDGYVGRISSLDFSSDGTILASTSDEDNLLRVWRTDKWEEVLALRELAKYRPAFSFHPSLPILASVCSLREPDDNSSSDSPMAIRIWEFDYDAFLSNPPFMEEFNTREAESRTKLLRDEVTEDLELVKIGVSPVKGIKLQRVLKGHAKRIHQISWSPDGKYLASPADDKTVRIWDEETGVCISTLEEQDEIKHCSWSPDGQNLIYGGNKQIRLWGTKTLKSVDLLQKDFLDLHSLAFSPDGKMLALSYGYNTIQILDTSTWMELSKKVIDPRSNCRITLQWSNDGHQLMASPFVGWIHVLDIKTLKSITKIAIPGDRNDMYGFSFLYASFRNKIAVAEEKKPIRIFDLESGQLQIEFSEATSYVSGLSFSPDGRILVSWCQNNSVYLWNVETGQKLAQIHEYSLRIIEPVYPSFHPFKSNLVTFCDKRCSMRIWDIDYEELLG